MWKMTCDTWHLTHGTWQVWGGEPSLTVWGWRRFKDISKREKLPDPASTFNYIYSLLLPLMSVLYSIHWKNLITLQHLRFSHLVHLPIIILWITLSLISLLHNRIVSFQNLLFHHGDNSSILHSNFCSLWDHFSSTEI